MIIRIPVQIAEWPESAVAAPPRLTEVHAFDPGLYRAPSFNRFDPTPPHTIISLPDQIAVCRYRAAGVPVGLVGVQLFVPGLYRPPSLNFVTPWIPPPIPPPHTIISLPVHTAVCARRAAGAPLMLSGVQLFVVGL